MFLLLPFSQQLSFNPFCVPVPRSEPLTDALGSNGEACPTKQYLLPAALTQLSCACWRQRGFSESLFLLFNPPPPWDLLLVWLFHCLHPPKASGQAALQGHSVLQMLMRRVRHGEDRQQAPQRAESLSYFLNLGIYFWHLLDVVIFCIYCTVVNHWP